MIRFLGQFHRDESGQDLLEYALVLVAVLTAIVAGSNSLASILSNAYSSLNSRIQSTIS